MSALTSRDESDYDSSSSSITVPESSRSWMSFESRRSSISVCSSQREPFLSYYGTTGGHKPHKANQVAWEVMRRLLWSKGGQVGLEHFRLLRRLGSGDIGNVYLCQIRNPVVGLPQCFYAMKVVDKEALAIRNKLQRAEMEKEIVGMLDHPFLPTLYTHFEASHYSCWVMEYCPGGDLYASRQRQPAKRFSVSSAKFYAAETLLALEYLHMMGIVYRDLKPENVLVREDGHIMLSDFDLSFKCDVVPKLIKHNSTTSIRNNNNNDNDEEDDDENHNVRCSTPSCVRTPLHPVLSCFSRSSTSSKSKKHTITTTIREHADQTMVVDIIKKNSDDVNASTNPELIAEPINARSKSFVGTHEYLAPEVISGQGHGSAVDWWTLGVFIYEMLYGKTPFKGETNEKTLINILKQPLTFPKLNHNNYGGKECMDMEMVKAEDLLRKLLVKNPKKRIGSLKGSVEIKRHEFFKGVNWALIRSVKPPVIPAVHNLSGSRSYWPKYLSKKDRDAPYQIPPQHFDYF